MRFLLLIPYLFLFMLFFGHHSDQITPKNLELYAPRVNIVSLSKNEEIRVLNSIEKIQKIFRSQSFTFFGFGIVSNVVNFVDLALYVKYNKFICLDVSPKKIFLTEIFSNAP